MTRLTKTGLAGQIVEGNDQARAGLASFGCALAVFLGFGIAIWSQLTIGWQWSQPSAEGTTMAEAVMSVMLLIFVMLTAIAALPIAWHILVRFLRREGGGLVRPSLLFVVGATVLIIGSRHFGNGWPGTGGHPWAHQGLVPGGLAAFTWASTLSVSSYWVHPGALAAFPPAEIAWMVVSPLAMTCVVVGAAKTVRRLELSRRVLRYEGRLASIAVVVMIGFLGGSGLWVIDGGPGPRNLFHAGAIDVAGLTAMAMALAVAYRAISRARRSGLLLPPG